MGVLHLVHAGMMNENLRHGGQLYNDIKDYRIDGRLLDCTIGEKRQRI